jgi:hypothetical protein
MRVLVPIVRELFGWFVLALLWAREIFGWLCLVFGLLVFYQCFAFLVSTPPRIIEVAPLMIVGFMVFRGGIHLLKVSAAGLVCLRAQKQAVDVAESGMSVKKPAAAARTRLRTGPFELGPRVLPR